MPNWCRNTFEVNGTTEAVTAFLDKFIAEGFAAHFPPPEDYKQDTAECFGWCSDNWGCKWTPDSEFIAVTERADGYARMQFDTPWGPPNRWLERIGGQLPDLRFRLDWMVAECGECGVTTPPFAHRELSDDCIYAASIKEIIEIRRAQPNSILIF
jgi:hypothetical protein